MNLTNCYSNFTVIYMNGEGIPISFPIGNNGLASITSLRLNLRFQLNMKSLMRRFLTLYLEILLIQLDNIQFVKEIASYVAHAQEI